MILQYVGFTLEVIINYWLITVALGLGKDDLLTYHHNLQTPATLTAHYSLNI